MTIPTAARADLHTHTALCRHASGKPEEYLAAAAKAGLAYLGVSDHFPAPAGYDAEFRMNPSDLPLYFDIVSRLSDSAGEFGIQILCAAEYDFVPGRMAELGAVLDPLRTKFDYLIGSVHYVDGFAFDDPDKIAEWARHGKDEIWDGYLANLLEFVQLGGFQVLAHPDLPKKFGFRHSRPETVLRRFQSIFEEAAGKGIYLELNTAGLRVPAREIYPSLELLRAAFAAGMGITLGSDAHKPGDVASAFDQAAELARSIGWRTAAAFRHGCTIELPL